MAPPSQPGPRDAQASSLADGLALLAGAVGEQRNPAAAVADRALAIRITGMRTFWVGPVLFLRLETSHGVTGWGDVKGVDPRPARALARSLFGLLDGENPTRIEHLWQKLFRAHRNLRGGPLLGPTLSRIDMAPWDLAGKPPG